MLCRELRNAIENNCVGHAYLIDSYQQAMDFCKALDCRQVDFTLVQREGKAHILVSDIERLQEELKFKPYGDIKFALIKDAEYMLVQAQNKLLKTLEEPFPGTVIVLCSNEFSGLLPTVQSRCIKICCNTEDAEADDNITMLAESFFKLKEASSPFYKLKNCIRDINDRSCAEAFLICLEELIEKRFLSVPDVKFKELLLSVEEAEKNIRQGFNVSYILKALCLGGKL